MPFIKILSLLCLCAGISSANLFQDEVREDSIYTRRRTSRTTKPSWPIQCVYTSMIKQDDSWFLYRPILDCCYGCRKPYHECSKKIHAWFCYREAYICSTQCIAKAYWHGKKKTPENTAQILKNYPLTSSHQSKDSPASDNFGGDPQSLAARPPRLPCFGHLCYGEMCFRTQLCYEVDSRYLKNIPAVKA